MLLFPPRTPYFFIATARLGPLTVLTTLFLSVVAALLTVEVVAGLTSSPVVSLSIPSSPASLNRLELRNLTEFRSLLDIWSLALDVARVSASKV